MNRRVIDDLSGLWSDMKEVVIVKVEQTEVEEDKETTPPVRYKQCDPALHEVAIEVEGYCPCYDGVEIDWVRMGEGWKAAELGWI